jgi:hypothetical protein
MSNEIYFLNSQYLFSALIIGALSSFDPRHADRPGSYKP